MKVQPLLIQKAVQLRLQGNTYKEIHEQLGVAKSTLHHWFSKNINKDIEEKIKKKNYKIGKQKIIIINKQRSIKTKLAEDKSQHKYSKQILKINKESLFWLGLGLYLAEGSKTGRWKSVFYNSNPALNQIMIKFFREICEVNENNIHIQLVLHENIKENTAKQYWSRVLKVPQSNFYKASYVTSRSSKGKRPKNRLPFGTVQIAITGKENTNKIKGWMKGIINQYPLPANVVVK